MSRQDLGEVQARNAQFGSPVRACVSSIMASQVSGGKSKEGSLIIRKLSERELNYVPELLLCGGMGGLIN